MVVASVLGLLSADARSDDFDQAAAELAVAPRTARERADFESLRTAWILYLSSEDQSDTDIVVAASRIVAAEPELRRAKAQLNRVSRGSKYGKAKNHLLRLVTARLTAIPKIRASFRAVAERIQAEQAAGAATYARGPPCAENGSCYGDISQATGRPKTVNVRGYYRKDGTYVRGHYRSRPRR
jgi:hypothetical protein